MEETEEKPTTTKKRPHSKPERRGRIIIRNLSFKATEDKLREHFKEFGNVTEVNILKKANGKLVGCAFVQFDVVQNAAKAIHHKSGKEFLGRPIICDWAVAKDTYLKKQNVDVKEKPEVKEEKDVEIIKDEVDDDVEEIKEKKESSDKEESDESDEEESDESDDSDESESEEEAAPEPAPKRPRIVSNDVAEGKTVFIKNVPFHATNDDLKECVSQFGEFFYALICIDPITEHSKGTAFVKFKNEEDAQKCLEAGTELTLLGNILDCHKALSKNDLINKKPAEEKKKASRNLYLVKEGVILAGSNAGQSISASDMAKRLQLERWKTQMLRNLNMFVSKYRLIVHNLPLSYDDSKFRKLIQMHAGPKCTVKECRIMRNMRSLDEKGQGQSKEYGFVSFETHEDALKVLRSLNNNPNVFSENKRPIVAFSIENKSVLNAKKKRVEKSKLNNPTYLKKHPDAPKPKENPKKPTGQPEPTEFMGVTAKQGDTKFRSRTKLKTQAMIHHENVKKRKKQVKRKLEKTTKKESIRQPQQKRNTKKTETDNFSKLVNKYKTNLSVSNAKIKKWYE